MSRGKYSPFLTRAMINARADSFIYNAHGNVAPDYVVGEIFDEKLHGGHYDKDGYDYYGYSAWNADGEYAGLGNGIDRGGYTESDYLSMSDSDFEDVTMYQ
jgi:hypothetical protein